MCKACGCIGPDFNLCIRCKRKIPKDAKVIDDPDKPKPRITAEVDGQHQDKAVPDVDAELVKKDRKKKKKKPKVKPLKTENKAKEAAVSQPSGPVLIGDDPDWEKIKRVWEELKAQCDEMSEEEDVLDKCAFCSKEDFDMPRCGRCKVFAYCDEKCARQNARNHERECEEAREDSLWNRALRELRSQIGPVVLRPEAGDDGAKAAAAARPAAAPRVAQKKKKKKAQKF